VGVTGGSGVAIARHSVDLWTQVQKRVWEDASQRPASGSGGSGKTRTFPYPVVRTLRLSDADPYWFSDRFERRASSALTNLERALASGDVRRVTKARAAWMHAAQMDRLARVKDLAASCGLRLDPMGRGPLVELPTVHYRDRLPWSLLPLQRYDDDNLPMRASSIVDAWNECGDVFDRYYLAHEPRCSASIPTHSLIGAVSGDGRSADWFALDRWAS
jgi:hypothetical protein